MNENIIKKTCKELGITQKELAEKMGVSQNTMSQWGRGITPIPKMAFLCIDLMKKEKNFNELTSLVDKLK